MTKRLQMKYLKFDPRGQYRYRRRVPKELAKVLGKSEFVKVLGHDEEEALKEYLKYHRFVERLISGTHQNATPLDPKVDLSLFCAAPSARLSHLSFEGDRAFP
ncbi:MAG: hypothetical protein ACSHXW_18845, partial [Yoonia sp.]